VSVLLFTLPFLALGILSGRFSALVVPPVASSLYFAGLARGWWGSGLGDGWPFALIVITAAGLAATAAGSILRQRLRPTRGTQRKPFLRQTGR
jgi:hypothetical protein